jgi:hypothetical protein
MELLEGDAACAGRLDRLLADLLDALVLRHQPGEPAGFLARLDGVPFRRVADQMPVPHRLPSLRVDLVLVEVCVKKSEHPVGRGAQDEAFLVAVADGLAGVAGLEVLVGDEDGHIGSLFISRATLKIRPHWLRQLG